MTFTPSASAVWTQSSTVVKAEKFGGTCKCVSKSRRGPRAAKRMRSSSGQGTPVGPKARLSSAYVYFLTIGTIASAANEWRAAQHLLPGRRSHARRRGIRGSAREPPETPRKPPETPCASHPVAESDHVEPGFASLSPGMVGVASSSRPTVGLCRYRTRHVGLSHPVASAVGGVQWRPLPERAIPPQHELDAIRTGLAGLMRGLNAGAGRIHATDERRQFRCMQVAFIQPVHTAG